jgi:hypothetical protein
MLNKEFMRQKITRLIRKHNSSLQLALSLFTAVFVGIYINLITSDLQRDNLFTVIQQAGWTNLWAILSLFTLMLQVLLPGVEKISQENKHRIIKNLLEASARSLVYPRSIAQYEIRAFYHEADTVKGEFKPLCRWVEGYATDMATQIPFQGDQTDIFVISRAYRDKTILAENLPQNYPQSLPERLRGKIKKNLKCVLAAPVQNYEDDGQEVIGVIAFDSVKSLRDVGFDQQGAKDIAKLLAESIFILLTE